MIKAFKFRLYPTEEQKVLLSKHFGHTRFIYNWALDYKTNYYKQHKKNIHWMMFCKKDSDFIKLKKEKIWLKEVNSQSLIASLGNLDNAYKNFFEGRNGFPKYKKKHEKQSFQVPQHAKLDFKKSKIIIPKFKDGIDCVFHRTIPKGEIGTFTIEKRPSGRYFVSLIVHIDQELPKKPIPKNVIGLDFGLKTFITTSNGDKINNPEFGKKSLKKLAKLNKEHSRKVKGGKNRNKARIKLARLYEKVNNQRNDFLHKLSHKYTNDNQIDTICIEDLSLSGMKALWGRKTSDLSWGEFTRQLKYKSDWYGKNLIRIGRFDPSSKICSKCGNINHNLDIETRSWTCEKCSTHHDRDINAAKNIKDFGMNQYQLGAECTEVTPLEKKALAKNGKKNSETVFVELGKKKEYSKEYILKPIGL